MKSFSFVIAVGLISALTVSTAAADEIKVTGVHNCCTKCCKAIGEALKKVEGVSEITVQPKETEFTFQASDNKVTRKALGALARAGIHGKVNGGKVEFPNRSGVKAGKTTRLALVGIHNCCAGCCKAAKEAIAKVEGVEADTLKPNATKFVVEGNFDGEALIKAINGAGFSVRNADAPRRGGKKRKKKSDK